MAGNAHRVLVIDDVETMTRVMQLFLSRCGYQVETVNDSRNALSVVRKFQPEVILIDIAMPYLNGYELARRIRKEENFKSVPIIAVTAYNHEEHRIRAAEAGIDHQIAKPCDFRDLNELIQHCFAELS